MNRSVDFPKAVPEAVAALVQKVNAGEVESGCGIDLSLGPIV
jgi:hypothetical protein